MIENLAFEIVDY